MAMAFLSAPPPTFHQTSFLRPYPLNVSSINFVKYPSKSVIALSTSSSSFTVEDEPPASPILVQSEPSNSALEEGSPFRGCKACGKEELERGCNGEGRIQGGIATVPGFGWWPIKAYRPCPGFLASGGRYTRTGQSMDEVASGRGRKRSAVGTSDDVAESRKKNLGPRKFKR